jgi:hypothetical protein
MKTITATLIQHETQQKIASAKFIVENDSTDERNECLAAHALMKDFYIDMVSAETTVEDMAADILADYTKNTTHSSD